ncbi:hypothetical protein [Streptomyces sp. NPDC086023]|uniref:hypothetical protein n=1 Tax=Streptomyces sp. NPDC086023 TaxID=3365746 RepID=UPI0037D15D27
MSTTPFHELLTDSVSNGYVPETMYEQDSLYWELTKNYWCYAREINELVYPWQTSSDPRIAEARGPVQEWLNRQDTPCTTLEELFTAFIALEQQKIRLANSPASGSGGTAPTNTQRQGTAAVKPAPKAVLPSPPEKQEGAVPPEKVLAMLRKFHELGEVSPSQFCRMLEVLDSFGNEGLTVEYSDTEPADFRVTESDGRLENISFAPASAK